MLASFPKSYSAAFAPCLVLSMLWLGLVPTYPSLATEPPIEDLTGQVVTGVATLAEEHSVREAVAFDHPLDRTAHLLAELVASPSVKDAGYSVTQGVRELEAVVLEVQSADRRGVAVPEERTRELLDRSLELLDVLRLETSLEPGGPQPFVGTDTCVTAQLIGQTTDFDSTFNATSDGSASCGASAASPDQWYRFVAPTTETVIFEVVSADFDPVLSLHSGCPGTEANELACNDDTVGTLPRIERAMAVGEEVRVRVSGFAGDSGEFTLLVSSKTSVFGFITDSVTGDGLSVGVDLLSSSGFLVGFRFSNASGLYRFDVEPGTYFVRTSSSFRDKLYDDVPCESFCDVTLLGTPIIVASDQERRADIKLDPPGSISGTVTAAGSGDPVTGTVTARDLNDRFVRQTTILTDGTYSLTGLLPEGHRVQTSTGFIDERWEDARCEGGCASTVGAIVTVIEGRNSPNIDFVLDPAGSIAGTVTDGADGQPLENVTVRLFSAEGSSLSSRSTDADGTYTFGDLTTSSYRVRAIDSQYLDEVWDDIACEGGCTLSSGDLVSVTEGMATTGVDFALDLGGVLSGTVTNAVSGSGLSSTRLTIFEGRTQVDVAFSNFDGTWRMEDLPPGTYTARAVDFDFASQMFDGLDCVGSCDPVDGTPISLSLSEERQDIDFALQPFGNISGNVADTLGSPLSSLVRLFDETGAPVASRSTSSFSGDFSFSNVKPGTYYLIATSSGFLGELYQDIPCIGGCDPTLGTPVVLTAGDRPSDIDFSLSPRPVLTGTVVSQITGEPLASINVEALDTVGNLLGTAPTNSAGVYRVTPEFLGNVKLRARSTAFNDELYEEIPCEGGCDLSSGRTFSLTAGAKFLDLDFTLTGCDSPNERTVQFFLFKNPTVVEACRTVTSGEDVTVGDGGDVTFRAGESIVLGDGFAVLTGGSFKAEIVPELAPAP